MTRICLKFKCPQIGFFAILAFIFLIGGCKKETNEPGPGDYAKNLEGKWEWEDISTVNGKTFIYKHSWIIERRGKNEVSIQIEESSTGAEFYDPIIGKTFNQDFYGVGDAGTFRIGADGKFEDFFYCSVLRRFSGGSKESQEFNLGYLQGILIGSDYLKVISIDGNSSSLLFQFKRNNG